MRSWILLGLMGFCLFPVLPALASPQVVLPGIEWKDTAGNTIQAHGAGMIQVGSTFYWFGEDHTGETRDQSFFNVKCYSSRDLAHWTFRNNVLSRQADGDLGPSRVVERPKVIYNRRTRTYVMYMHIDSRSYAEAKVGVATCSRVDGNYTYRGSFRPMDHQSRDMTLFEDTDGSAYLAYEDRASGVRIAQLTPDYLAVDHEVSLIHHAYEALCIFKVKETYFLVGSHLSGWAPNPNDYATAPSLSGPWSDFTSIAPGSTNTYNSQAAYILPVVGRKGTTYVYMGDRWLGSDLKDSSYVWLPIQLEGQTLTLGPYGPWTIDTSSGISASTASSGAARPGS